MFHNVLMTTLTPLSNTNEIDCWENRPFSKVTPNPQQFKSNDSNLTRTIKKKNKRIRTSYTTEQLRVLERWFVRSKYLDRDHRRELSEVLGLGEKCIKIWFQNRRMKEKKESSAESSCDSSSEGCTESASPLPSIQTDPSVTQNTPDKVITEDLLKSSHHSAITWEQNVSTHSQFSNYQSVNDQQYFGSCLPVFSSFNNDTNVYPTQYYPCVQNGFNSITEPNQYYGFQSQYWPENNFNLSYM